MQKVDKKIQERLIRSKRNIQEAQYIVNASLFSHLLSAVPIYQTSGESNQPFLAFVEAAQGVIWVNPNGAKVHEKEVWATIIAHEALHLALNHHRRQEDREPQLWNLACDIVIDNLLPTLGFRAKAPICHAYPEFAKSTEEDIYDLLSISPKPLANFETLAGTGRQDMFSRGEIEISMEMKRVRNRYSFEKLFAEGIREATINAIENSAEMLGENIATTKKLWRPVEQARKWVLNEFPLLGPLAAQLKIIADSGVCAREDIGIAAVNPYLGEVYFNPDRPMSESEVRFVYVHELLHVALLHHTRTQGRDPYLWNVACDYVINDWLIEMGVGTMPQIGGLYDPRLKGMSSEEVYDIIQKDGAFRKKSVRGFRGKLGDILHEGGGRRIFKGDVTTLDDLYKRCMASGLSANDVGRGLVPSGLIEEIKSLFTAPVPWDVELARWMDAHVPMLRDPLRTYARASRRQASTPDIPRPAKFIPQEWKDACTFGVVLDTSGSMDRHLIGRSLGAIASYAEARDVPAVRLVLCDATPYDRGVVNPVELRGVYEIQGRGGTVLQPAINHLIRQSDFPANAPVMIITDGYCEEEIICPREHCFLLPRKSWKEGGVMLRTTAPVFRVLKQSFED